ncbi:N-formylglutamate amidohydrolase [Hyphomonas neptunium]|nr:N-formylglutamate amidohydrolase [Hyphomonas neptunium]
MPDTSPILTIDEGPPIEPPELDAPFLLSEPQIDAAPIVFASPHSGNHYPEEMVSALCVPLMDVRRTEDAFVDELFSNAPHHGGTLLAARFGRSVVDLNRDPHELDPAMFHDGPPRACALPTPRVEAGLGCLPRVGARGEAIYSRLLYKAEGERRLSGIHDVYHGQLSGLLDAQRTRHGRALLVDCHSMPSVQPGRRNLTDIVLGDRFGSSSDARLVNRLERVFRNHGLTVARNAPYAGGYTTRRYGRPKRGIHAIQIEINRGLYMDEQAITRAGGFSALRPIMDAVIVEMIAAIRELTER